MPDRPARTPEAPPAAGPAGGKSFLAGPYLPCALTAAFFIVGLAGVFRHEPWRDEMGAWTMARESSSLGDLFSRMRYEGQPGLWNVTLFAIARWTFDPLAMQLFHLALATAAVFVFTRFAPLSPLCRALYPFGYFPLFEYGIISRPYALEHLLLLIFCAASPLRRKSVLPSAFVLFLLANSSTHGLILSAALAGMIVYDRVRAARASPAPARRTGARAGLLLYLMGAFVSVLQILPPPDAGRHSTVRWPWMDSGRAGDRLGNIFKAYVPLPDFGADHFWNSHVLLPREPALLWGGVSSGVLLALCVLAIGRHRAAVFLFLTGTAAFWAFSYLLFPGSMRHHGHYFLLFIASLWIARRDPAPGFTAAGAGPGTWVSRVVPALMIVHAVAGAFVTAADFHRPFSNGPAAAAFIEENRLQNLPLIGRIDYAVSTVAGGLDRRIFYLEGGRWGTYPVWDKRRLRVERKPFIDRVVSATLNAGGEALLILNYDLLQDTRSGVEPIVRARWSGGVEIERLAAFRGAMVPDEDFVVYRLRRREP